MTPPHMASSNPVGQSVLKHKFGGETQPDSKTDPDKTGPPTIIGPHPSMTSHANAQTASWARRSLGSRRNIDPSLDRIRVALGRERMMTSVSVVQTVSKPDEGIGREERVDGSTRASTSWQQETILQWNIQPADFWRVRRAYGQREKRRSEVRAC
jgi:hypothetical protein